MPDEAISLIVIGIASWCEAPLAMTDKESFES